MSQNESNAGPIQPKLPLVLVGGDFDGDRLHPDPDPKLRAKPVVLSRQIYTKRVVPTLAGNFEFYAVEELRTVEALEQVFKMYRGCVAEETCQGNLLGPSG